MNSDSKKYFIVLLITSGIFFAVFWLVNIIDNKKLANIDDLQRKITVDLMATETQFDLLKTVSCDLLDDTVLSRELAELGEKLDFAQINQGSKDPDVEQLKKYYSLLQVKDYLLMEELSGKCNIDIDSVLYFYSSDCPECTKQGYVLTEFKKRYPEIRIYSFDTDLDFSVIETFVGLYDFGDTYPTLVINGKDYQEFQGLEDLEGIFPERVAEKKRREIVEQGIEYILGLEQYEQLNQDDIEFVGEEEIVYEYSITSLDRPQSITIVFDEESGEFEVEN